MFNLTNEFYDRLMNLHNPLEFELTNELSWPVENTDFQIYEATDGRIVYGTSIPGVSLENLVVSIDNGFLTITGTMDTPDFLRDARHLSGFYWKSAIRRSVVLMGGLDHNTADAILENGILLVAFNKVQATLTKSSSIPVRAA